MDQELALEVLLSGESAFVTGPAGSGKTFLLNKFIKLSKASRKHVSITASTGLAATHLGGTTIHSWAGIGVLDSLPDRFVDRMSKTRLEIIEKTDILVIDEVSMLHDFRLDMVDEVCRVVRRKDEPFGGIQVVMSGDFFQLPPINRGESRQGGFVIESRVWRELDPVVIYLNSQFRQDDTKLESLLSSMRARDLRRGQVEMLLERTVADMDSDRVFTELHTTNLDVDKINHGRLGDIDQEEVEFTRSTTGAQNYVDNLQRSVLAPEVLKLKKQALVMAVKNDSSRRYVNGSIGTVVDFEPVTNFPVVEFLNGRSLVVTPDEWEQRDGDKKRASISQIPLRLAWAITVHKSQGMTLDAARIDLRRAFVPGMGYVALSRVRRLDDLYLVGINRMALEMNEDAYQIDEQLRAVAKRDLARFEHLRADAKKRSLGFKDKVDKSKASGTSWKDKIAKMRETHPNAYMPWSHSDDETLKQDFLNGSSVTILSKKFGRHEGSIRMRLQKHFGEDVVSL